MAKKKLKNVRAIAARVLSDIILSGQSLDGALGNTSKYTNQDMSSQDRGMIQELAYGCMRWYLYLDKISARLLDRPLKKKDKDVQLIIIVGLYQILYMSTKPHAAVAETVSAAVELGKPWAKSLVNACLRKFLRQQQQLLDALQADDAESVLSHPQWLLQHLKKSYPEHWQTVVNQNNQRPPLHLRVNQAKTNREAMVAELTAADIETRILPAPFAIEISRPVPVGELPGFEAGLISVQDLSAQYAAELLDPQAGETVLDACAAPGGKTCHLLEMTNGELDLVAVEIDPNRTQRIQENLSRLHFQADLQVADVLDTAAWWSGAQFDRILLDAPCSATGVIRRHPDIKFHRRDSDIDNLVEIQRKLLDTLWPLLKQGGKLLYVTCSILARENEDQIKHLLEHKPDAKELSLSLEDGLARPYGTQLLPGEGDGFYYCLVEKI